MKKYSLLIATFFALGISSCKKDYLSLEVNPNNPSTTTPDLSLAAGISSAVNDINILYPQDGVWMGYWTPSGNFVPIASLQQFQITNTTYTALFNALYANLTNLNNLQTVASKDPALANYQAIAMIVKAYDFQELVDQFNDVPYSQAFQPSTILFPAYDKGIDIYHDLGKQLDAAIALINKSTTATKPGASDIMFGGDMTGWKKLANSIKVRLAIRVSTKFPTDPLVTDLASTASEGYLDENTQALVNPGYSNTLANNASQQSPFYLFYGLSTTNNPTPGNVLYRANDFYVNLLKNTNDPRLTAAFYPTLPAGAPVTDLPTVIKGNVFGDTKTTLTNPNTSAIGPGLLQSPGQNAVFFSGAESLFLQAEAVVDGFITGNAQDLYQRGIAASFVALQAGSTVTPVGASFTYSPASPAQSAALAVTYYSQNIKNVGWNASTDKKQAIIYQKYTSLVGYGNLEAHLEYERTGFPVLPNPVSIDPASISNIIPIRQFYPLSELSTNPNNLAKEGTIDIFKTPIFWAKQP
jgi:hypothetical protein